MSVRPTPNARLFPVAAAVAAVAAVVAVAVVVPLSRPQHFEDRLAAVESQADRSTRLLRAKGATAVLPRGAVCSSALPQEAERLKTQLETLASGLNLGSAVVDVALEEPGRAGDRLVQMRVRFEASGQYDAALGALDRLSEVRPALLVDTVDLNSKTSFVTLAVSGRVFCSAHP